MAKKKKIEPAPTYETDEFIIPDMPVRQDDACDLIYKLIDFYNKNPEYETPILEIYTLTRLAHQELKKFINRPHTQVTKVYFDSEAPGAVIIR